MKTKGRSVFVCSQCGFESPKWMGQCGGCGSWNTMTEETVTALSAQAERGRGQGEARPPSPIGQVASSEQKRLDTGIGELNRVLGGGLVKGSLTLISGEPGIGKSTLILQAAAKLSHRYGKVLYVTGEESEEQVKMRAERIGGLSERLFLLAETQTERILREAESLEPVFVIIDSIQTLYTEQLSSAPGSVSQVRACAGQMMRYAKTSGVPVFLVAHVTKSGELAGPKIIEHLVDTVLHFSGERQHDFRILRSYKNRFGTTSEIGAFEMGQEGLRELSNLSESFLEEASYGTEGAVITAVYEGTRPLLMEIQALVVHSGVGFARRTAVGIDSSRLSMIIAILEKKAGLSLLDKDVYINVTGGMKPEGTSTDLAVAAAIYSAARGIAVSQRKMIVAGELGLTGELRSVRQSQRIAREAERMGFSAILLPAGNGEKLKETPQLKVYCAKNLRQALDICFPGETGR